MTFPRSYTVASEGPRRCPWDGAGERKRIRRVSQTRRTWLRRGNMTVVAAVVPQQNHDDAHLFVGRRDIVAVVHESDAVSSRPLDALGTYNDKSWHLPNPLPSVGRLRSLSPKKTSPKPPSCYARSRSALSGITDTIVVDPPRCSKTTAVPALAALPETSAI